MSIQGWLPLVLTGLIFLLSKGFWRVFPAPQFEGINYSVLSLLYCQLSHPYMTTEKTIALTVWTLVRKAMSLLFNLLSRFVMAFLPRSKRLQIWWLQSILILEPKKRKSVTAFPFPPSMFHEVMGPDPMILVFFNVEFNRLPLTKNTTGPVLSLSWFSECLQQALLLSGNMTGGSVSWCLVSLSCVGGRWSKNGTIDCLTGMDVSVYWKSMLNEAET